MPGIAPPALLVGGARARLPHDAPGAAVLAEDVGAGALADGPLGLELVALRAVGVEAQVAAHGGYLLIDFRSVVFFFLLF